MMMSFHFLAVLTILLGFDLGSMRLKIVLGIALRLLCCNRSPSLLVKEHEGSIQLGNFLFLSLLALIIDCFVISCTSYFDINHGNFIRFLSCFEVSF